VAEIFPWVAQPIESAEVLGSFQENPRSNGGKGFES
jgi:hypothetical protein